MDLPLSGELSGNDKVCQRARNGVEREAVMDVYAKKHSEMTSKTRRREEHGTLSADAIGTATSIVEKVHETFAIINKGKKYKASAENLSNSMHTKGSEGILFQGTPVAASCRVSSMLGGVASPSPCRRECRMTSARKISNWIALR
ncbi:hypothetical protein EON65_37240 [archaeon]|nr:MAG: hypothetical protein EON65_37240 [archaeon]